MDIAQVHRAFMRTCREFVVSSKSTAREAAGRTSRAVTVSRERIDLSEEMIRRSTALLARREQRIIDTESVQGHRDAQT
jgi:hypothetical protein